MFKGLNQESITGDNLKDRRGKTAHRIYSTDEVKAFIETYKPTVSHYRHYLTPEVTIRSIHADLKNEKGSKISYFHFYKIFKSMNISYAVLGHEECEICSAFKLHKTNCNCETVCKVKIFEYICHRRRYREARVEYGNDTAREDKLIMSADLQKVIMLPRMDQFKKAIFTRRLTVFNETFAGVSQGSPNVAVLWHEGTSGRNDADLASVFHRFFIEFRDDDEIVLWLDNCSRQNKNWTLFSMLVVLINSDEIQATKITLKYFQPGHTFMSADACHSKIENQMKKMKKVYDLNDFVTCVNKAKCKPILMENTEFRLWESGLSQHFLNKLPKRPYLNDMVCVIFKRGHECLFYKNDFTDEEPQLVFLKTTFPVQMERRNRKNHGEYPHKKRRYHKKISVL